MSRNKFSLRYLGDYFLLNRVLAIIFVWGMIAFFGALYLLFKD
jgi:hypothetical protein